MEDKKLQFQAANLSISNLVGSAVQQQFAISQAVTHPYQLAIRRQGHLLVTPPPKTLSDSDNHEDTSPERQFLEVPSPTEVLNASEVDPFASMPVDLPASMLSELMDQSMYNQFGRW